MSEVIDTVLKNATILLAAHNATEGEHKESHETHETHETHESGEHSEHHGVHIPGESIVSIWIMTCLIISAFGKILQKKYNV